MNYIEQTLIKIASEELIKKEFETTKQFLEIHSIEVENDDFKIANIIMNEYFAYIFFNVWNEDFYFVAYFNLKSIIEIAGTSSEPKFEIYVQSGSEVLSDKNLMEFTKLVPTRHWNIGDKRKSGKTFYKFSSLIFEPTTKPDFFENKLKNTLDFLENDREGIFKLSENSNSTLVIFTTYHNGNTLLDDIFISKEDLKRISNLNLNIEFAGFAKGNFYKD